MTRPTPAFEYGYRLGRMQRGIEEMFRQIGAGMQAAMRPTYTLTTEEREERIERLREAAYRHRIESERRTGLAFVRAEAASLRRELGLDR